MSSRKVVGIAFLLFLGAASASQAQTPAPDRLASFDKSEIMVPMRDGVRLHTTLYVPKNLATNLPFILTRTPYGIAGSDGNFATSYAELADEGYIFVFQDIRGRFASEGQFV